MNRLSAAVCSASIALLTLGCAPTNDTEVTPASLQTAPELDGESQMHDHDHEAQHDHDHDSLTLAGVIESLESQKSQIETAFEEGTPDDAHDVMHDIGHTISDLVFAGKNEGLDDDGMAKINEASETLMDAFGMLDEGMHGGAETPYSDVRADVNGAMETLETLIGSATE